MALLNIATLLLAGQPWSVTFGYGLCGANAHAATLCPSFYRAEIVQNPRWHERLLHGLRTAVVRALQPA